MGRARKNGYVDIFQEPKEQVGVLFGSFCRGLRSQRSHDHLCNSDGALWGWAPQGQLWSWALKGRSGVAHSRTLWGWAPWG